jgi:hypothetical protein
MTIFLVFPDYFVFWKSGDSSSRQEGSDYYRVRVRVSHFTTGGIPPISSSWRRAPWDSQPEFLVLNWTPAVTVLIWHPLWREEWVCHLQLLLALASAFILGSKSHGTRDHILLSQIRDFPLAGHRYISSVLTKHKTQLPTVLLLLRPSVAIIA